MKKILLIFLIVLIPIFVGISIFLLKESSSGRDFVFTNLVDNIFSRPQPSVFPDSFRSKIYTLGSSFTLYSGSGEVREIRPERLLIISGIEGGPIKEIALESQEQIDLLTSQGNQVHILNADNNYLLYLVGKFQGLRSIEGSEDKLILLTDPTDSSKVYTYRVARIKTDSSGYTFVPDRVATRIDVERQDAGVTTDSNSVEIIGLAVDISNQEMDKIFQVGDIVIVTPVPKYPNLQTFDEEGTPFANVLTIRRKNGLVDVRKDIQ